MDKDTNICEKQRNIFSELCLIARLFEKNGLLHLS